MGRPPSPQFRDPETLVAGNPDESDYDVSAPGSQTASYVTNEPDTSFPSICGVLVTDQSGDEFKTVALYRSPSPGQLELRHSHPACLGHWFEDRILLASQRLV